MTEITVDTGWINDAEDPSDYQSFPLMSALSVTPSIAGTVRHLAGGRTRLVMTEGTSREVSLSLPDCDRDQVEWLEEHIGRIVCVRDDRGRKTFAGYLRVPVTEQQGDIVDKPADVTVSLAEISYDEAV